MSVNIKPFNQPYLYNYKYDQLNRLTGVDTYTGLDTSSNTYSGLTYTKSYRERVSYDGNGNIKKYNRFFDATSGPMDSLTYVYTAGTNRLTQVKDSSGNAINALKKIKNQVANNYAYDEIGNLIKDSSEYISTGGIKWNVYGKITEINHYQQEALVSTKKISYTYDAAGNRIGKKVVKFGSPTVSYTWYVRDARGNVMQVYTASGDTTAADTTDAARLSRLSTANLVWAESHLYGSSRLGLLNQYVSAESRSGGGVVYETRGYKFYEIANHLGNVLGVITDKKMAHTSNGTTVDYYNPDIVNVADYYPFGMPSRSAYLGNFSLNYRYSFNGKENDADVKGDGDQIDYGNRIYDPRLGRFLSLDPLQKKYPDLTPYQFASNRPIDGVDLDGREHEHYTVLWEDKTKKPVITNHTIESDKATLLFWEVKVDHVAFVNYPSGSFGDKSFELRGPDITTFQKWLNNPNDYRNENGSPMELGQLFESDAARQLKAINYSLATGAEMIQNAPLRTTIKSSGEPATSQSTNSTQGTTQNLKGANNPNTKAAASLGNKVHYDQLNHGPAGSVGLPSELQARYPQTQFNFAHRGTKGADVEVVGGLHPSQYPNSTWVPGKNFADFKPGNASGAKKFMYEIKAGKLPANTQRIDYNPGTGKLR